jgi:hypothetical protein
VIGAGRSIDAAGATVVTPGAPTCVAAALPSRCAAVLAVRARGELDGRVGRVQHADGAARHDAVGRVEREIDVARRVGRAVAPREAGPQPAVLGERDLIEPRRQADRERVGRAPGGAGDDRAPRVRAAEPRVAVRVEARDVGRRLAGRRLGQGARPRRGRRVAGADHQRADRVLGGGSGRERAGRLIRDRRGVIQRRHADVAVDQREGGLAACLIAARQPRRVREQGADAVVRDEPRAGAADLARGRQVVVRRVGVRDAARDRDAGRGEDGGEDAPAHRRGL